MDPRPTPRISVCKLGEYVLARPRRRRAILAAQKFPQDFIVSRYRDAQAALTEYLVTRNLQALQAARRRLGTGAPASSWDATRRTLCIAAIDHFVQLIGALPLNGSNYRATPTTMLPLRLCGVDVSVRPELLLQGDTSHGGIKLYFGKSTPLAEAAPYIATTLHQYVQTLHPGAQARDCTLLDVFAHQHVAAPSATHRLRRELLAA
jgi:hypothetical protein